MRKRLHVTSPKTLLTLLLLSLTTSAPPDPKPTPRPLEKVTDLSAATAALQMSPGINIGNTLENTTHWETGWGAPPVTQEYIQSLARLGFKTVRLPVAWDTYAINGQIQPDKFQRVSQIVNWITDAHMFCVLNIHWDGGWIDSDVKDKFPKTFHTFTPEAQSKFQSYWHQISTFFAGKNEKLLFEALNEESNFDNEGSPQKAHAALTHANQLFIDTVRSTGGNNPKRLLIIAGYTTDITKTASPDFHMPHDSTPDKLFISLHFYSPWQFVGMSEDASWGKMMRTWGTPDDLKQLNQLFDTLNDFSTRNNTPAFIGEFAVTSKKEEASRIRWLSAVANAALSRKMVPVLWDTGTEVSRLPPVTPPNILLQTLHNLKPNPATSP